MSSPEHSVSVPEKKDSKILLAEAQQAEQTFLENNTDKFRGWTKLSIKDPFLKGTKEEQQVNFLRYYFFNHAINNFKFDKETFHSLSTEKDLAFDRAAEAPMRSGSEGEEVPVSTKRRRDHTENSLDRFNSMVYINKDKMNDKDVATFFGLQINILQTKIDCLLELGDNAEAKKEIEKLQKRIETLRSALTRAENRHLFSELESLKTEVSDD